MFGFANEPANAGWASVAVAMAVTAVVLFLTVLMLMNPVQTSASSHPPTAVSRTYASQI